MQEWLDRNNYEVREARVSFGVMTDWLKQGGAATLPEWKGLWIKAEDEDVIYAHTFDQQVVAATHFQLNVFRTDWILLS